MSTKPIIVPIIVDDKTGQAFFQLNDKLLQMKSRASETMNQVRSDTEKARASIALLGEDIGVKIPRHLQTLIAESELAKGALTAAFSGIALIALVDVLARIPAAFDKIIGELSGWTEEAKKAYQAQVDLNEIAIKGAEKVQETLYQNSLIGLDGSKKFQQEEKNKQDEIKRTTTLLQQQNDELLRQQKIKNVSLSDILSGATSPESFAASLAGYAALKIATQPVDPKDLEKLSKAAQETKAKLDDLKVSAQGVGKEIKVAFGEESKKAAQDFADGVIQSWKNINEMAKANEQVDKDAAAMMKVLASEQKQIGNILGISSASPKDPLANMKSDFEDISAALKSEKAQEQAIIDKANEYGLSQQTMEQKLRPIRQKTIDDLKDTADEYLRIAKLSGDQTQIENAKKVEAELDAMKIKAQSLSQVLGNDLLKQGLAALEGIATQTKSVSQAFKDMALSIIQEIEKMIVEWLFFKAISGIMSFAAGPAPSVASVNSAGLGSLSSMHFPGFASGGDFSAGMPMIVGENGPELMLPKTSGSIIPNSKMGGNVYNIDARNAQPGVERDIMRAIKASEDRAVVRSVRTLDSRAKRRG